MAEDARVRLPPEDVEALVARMRRIEGQARGVQRMIREQQPCEDILAQIEAMRAALQKVKLALGECHLRQEIVRQLHLEERDDEELRRCLERMLHRL